MGVKLSNKKADNWWQACSVAFKLCVKCIIVYDNSVCFRNSYENFRFWVKLSYDFDDKKSSNCLTFTNHANCISSDCYFNLQHYNINCLIWYSFKFWILENDALFNLWRWYLTLSLFSSSRLGILKWKCF